MLLVLLATVLLLSACSTTQPITAETTGIWNHYFVYPLSWLIVYTAEHINGSYGLAIVLVTLLIRFVLLPLTLKQSRSSKAMQSLKPELDLLKSRYDLKNQQEQMKFQQEMLQLYKNHGVNPLAGCLPILIQMPILMAFYYAIMRTEQIALHTFLWFDLGNPDPYFILPVVAAATTYLQVKMTASTLPENMRFALLLMPAMILIAAIAMPSALSLYWVIGNIFVIVQTYFLYTKNKPVEVKA